MTSWEPRQLVSKAAKQYADLGLVEFDLRQVEDCCVELIKLGHERYNVTANALIDSALIRYRLCFSKGQRTKLSHLVESLTLEEQALHLLVKTIADNHIAHSSNDYELACATVQIAKGENGRLRRGGIGAHMSFTIPLTQHELRQFAALSKRWQHEVAIVMEKLKTKLSTDVEAMSEVEVAALDDALDLVSARRPPDEYRVWPPRKQASSNG